MTRNNPNGSPLDDEEFDPLADEAPSPEIDAIVAERDEYRDRFMRALADAENARKRADKDRRDAEQYGGSRLARDLLPVYDALSRALESAGDDQRAAASALIEGVELTLRELKNVFAKHGIVVITPELGEKFDPQRHEAMFEAPVPGTVAGNIIQVMDNGFMLHDRLLRPAKVGVSSMPAS
ncbi:nucleotide exchange factor GrpE [Paracoccus sp. (in: a-proteobacteria)]|uniref:nucleotide exchange factor GrpE n=1 Tax=Paracoccus sp. TaxID=267 RepID=UPI0035B26FC8